MKNRIIKQLKHGLLDWVHEIRKSNLPIIVEGNKDKAALEQLGITRITTLSKQPLFAVVEELAKTDKEIIILTDFDKKGKELYGTLKKHSEHVGLKVNHGFREWLQRNTPFSHIEGMKVEED